MPDPSPPKRQPRTSRTAGAGRSVQQHEPGYAELHCRTNYSFLEGASHPDELVQRAAELDYKALAITDRNSLAGVVRAHAAAKDLGFKLLIGAEITPVDAPPVVLLATDRAAYGRLSRLITCGRRRAEKGECLLTFNDIAAHAEGLIACVLLGLRIDFGELSRAAKWEEEGARGRGGEREQIRDKQRASIGPFSREPQGERDPAERRRGEEDVSARGRGGEGGRRRRGDEEGATSRLSSSQAAGALASSASMLSNKQFRVPRSELRASTNPQSAARLSSPKSIRNPQFFAYRDLFGDRCYAMAELHLGPHDELLLAQMQQLAREARIPLVAANDVHFHQPDRQMLQDVLTAVRLGCTVAELGEQRFSNGQRYLKSPRQMADLFAGDPAAVARTVEIADRCHFSLAELRYEYPEELCPPGTTPSAHLQRLAWEGAHRRYPHGIPDKVRGLIEHELKLIEELHYEAYFLTVWDLVRFARSRGILCQGRGSAANSAVCYCLEVTSVDPERIDVLFERFVSKERNEAPDIDVDFEHERREEVIQYVYNKYGRERAGMTAEVITYRPRSAVRDVGKALGLSLDRVDRLAKTVENYNEDAKLASRFREAGMNPTSTVGKQLISLVRQILGFPRHLSQHVGGLVITQGPLCELVPIENAAMPERTVIQWDKDDLDTLEILKVDCLALGMLTAIHRCFDFVDQSLTLANVPAEDPVVYEMIQRADTMGVFQIESRAQMSMLPRLKPKSFYDLVIEVAIVRPGPIQGNMVHPYLRRRAGEETVEFPDDNIRAVLEKTLGVPIFQEQAMRLAVVAAGFTPGEADQLRRAMGAWRKTGVIDRFRQKLIDGMLHNGYSVEFGERVFNQIRGFGEYGFPESHAASFALLVYVSSWLKCYYPEAFAAALLNSQPMGFYAPAQLIADARHHGVEVQSVDVNASDWDCTLRKERRGDAATRGRGEEDVSEMGRGGEGERIRDKQRASIGPFSREPQGERDPERMRRGDAETRRRGEEEVSESGRGGEGGRRRRGEEEGATSRLSSSQAAGALTSSASMLSNRQFRAPHSALRASSNPQSAIRNPQSLRLGFRLIRGLSRSHAEKIVRCREEGGLFTSFDEFARRTGLSNAVLARLARADAFGSLQMNRRTALWQSLPEQKTLPLFVDVDADEPPVELAPMSPLAEVVADYQTAGLSLRDHPMKFIRPLLSRLRAVRASQLATLKHDSRLRVAGLVLLRQRPSSAKGITFVTLEDETGFTNLIVRQEVWERYHQVARTASVMLAHGRLQRQGKIIHLLVYKLEDLSKLLAGVDSRSRDFR